MKKKMIMVAMFVGALSLGSCVDNNESASVEAVRGAKTEQLKSVAAMNNAEAEAKKAITAAEVALKEAEAAYKKAEAEAKQADAEQAKILLQKAQAGLEAQLEANKVLAEAALAEAKAGLEKAKAGLIAAMDDVDAATKERIKNLLVKADGLLTTINNDRSSLVTEKNNLAKAKAGLITAELARKQLIATQEKNKVVSQSLIAEYEKYSKDDKANAEKAAKDADAKKIALERTLDEKSTANTNAFQAYRTALQNVTDSRFVTVLQRNSYYTTEIVVSKSVYYTNDDATTGFVSKAGYTKYIADVERLNTNIKNGTRDLSVAKAGLADANKALTAAKATDTYKGYVTAVAEAQKKFDEAKTESEKRLAQQELSNAEGTLKQYIQGYELPVKDATQSIERIEDSLVKLNEILTVATGADATAYTKLLDVLVASIDSQVEASIALGKADHNYSVQELLAQSLNNVASGLADYADLILVEKKKIASADELIADAAAIVTKEQLIANTEKLIAKFENNLSVNEPIYNDYLAQIKALVEAGK